MPTDISEADLTAGLLDAKGYNVRKSPTVADTKLYGNIEPISPTVTDKTKN